MPLTTLSQEQFIDFCQSLSYKSFMQSVQMADLLKKRGAAVEFVAYSKEDTVLVGAVLYSMPMTGGLHMEINSGPAAADRRYLNVFYEELRDYAKKKRALELIVKPYDTYQTFDTNGQPIDQNRPELIDNLLNAGYEHDGLLTGYPGGEPDWHYVKDLTELEPASLIKSFSKKGRPLIKKAKTFGIKLRPLKRDELTIFKDVTAATSNRRDYQDKPLDYYQDFYDSFGPDCEFMIASLNFQDYLANLQKDQNKLGQKISKLKANLAAKPSKKKQNQLREITSQFETFSVRIAEAEELIAKHGSEDVVLAASLFIYTAQEAVYLFSGSYPEFNKFYAPTLLQEYVMLEAMKRGIKTYNLLGITGEFDGSDGVLRFKQNFNGYITRKTGTFRYYPHPLKAKFLQGLKKILGRQ
ncbi:aminoacyltransferase [Streptococcus sp. H49]|uniref:aminoacyltransferase n=1 Tax=Streptococcus huangxiaojuni TaxID=3237239 RepID=UPI0034A29113